MQSEYSRSHLLKAYARQCANTVGIQAESTNREIDYDVMNDIVPIVIWHYCRNAVGRLHSDYILRRLEVGMQSADCIPTVKAGAVVLGTFM